MKITITDPQLLAQLTAAPGGVIELADPSGRVVAQAFTDWPGKPPAGHTFPWTDAEVAELRQQRTGRPLADILRDLEARG